MLKQNWSDISEDPISEASIRALHVPEENFKLYANTYQAGESFTIKAGNNFVLYVLEGACKTTINSQVLQLSAGEFAFLDKGAHDFRVSSKDAVRLVRVFGTT